MWILFGSVYLIYVNRTMQSNNKIIISINRCEAIIISIKWHRAILFSTNQYRSTQFSTSWLIRQYKPAYKHKYSKHKYMEWTC